MLTGYSGGDREITKWPFLGDLPLIGQLSELVQAKKRTRHPCHPSIIDDGGWLCGDSQAGYFAGRDLVHLDLNLWIQGIRPLALWYQRLG